MKQPGFAHLPDAARAHRARLGPRRISPRDFVPETWSSCLLPTRQSSTTGCGRSGLHPSVKRRTPYQATVLIPVGTRVEAEPVDLTSGVERDQLGLPVTLEGQGAARGSSRSW